MEDIEEFKLPKKWCIKDCKIVSKWAAEQFDCLYEPGTYFLHVKDLFYSFEIEIHTDYTEITLEQFKKYVLKEKDTLKFEVGKWYRRDTGTYVKFLRLNYKEILNSNRKYKKILSSMGSINNGVNTYTLLTDLSEIQQYLPDGHPDKFKTDVIPEYVECIKKISNQNVGDIEKTSELPKWVKGWSLKKTFWDSYIQYYKPSTKEAYEAQNKPKSLVGRYLKALVNNPQAITMAIDEYCIITSNQNDITRVKDNRSGYSYSSKELGIKWELMPEGFDPNVQVTDKKFPSEGCVYAGLSDLEPLTKYLLSRPGNSVNTEITKKDAIGIGWNKTSCWWLKTNMSTKERYSVQEINKLFDYNAYSTTSKLITDTTSDKSFETKNPCCEILLEQSKTDKSEITIKEVIKPTISVEYQLNNSITEIKLGLPVREVKKVQPIKINLINIKL